MYVTKAAVYNDSSLNFYFFFTKKKQKYPGPGPASIYEGFIIMYNIVIVKS